MYLGHPYYPKWLDNLADDVTGEGAAMQGIARGAEAVRSIVVAAREEYKHQEFSFTGDFADDGFIEEYSCEIRGEPTKVVVTVHRNKAGKTQHLVVNHRPRSSVLLFARLMGEQFAGTPLAELFIVNASQKEVAHSSIQSESLATVYRRTPHLDRHYNVKGNRGLRRGRSC